MIDRKFSLGAMVAGAFAFVFLGSAVTSAASAEEQPKAQAEQEEPKGPKLVRAVAPEYPRAAERREIEGVVELSIDIDKDGKVLNVKVLTSSPEGVFDSAATRAVQRWKFEAGKPTLGLTKRLVFQINGDGDFNEEAA